MIDSSMETLCFAAEVTAVVLLLTMAWRPRPLEAQPVASLDDIDWSLHESVTTQALIACGRILIANSNPLDRRRLQNVQRQLPRPWSDRLTGLMNSSGMDPFVIAWGEEEDRSELPSCYALVSLKAHDRLMSHYGAMVTEMGILRIADHLGSEFTERAVVSRYQPYRFLMLVFGVDEAVCQAQMIELMGQIQTPGFFQYRDENVGLECEAQIWQAIQPIDPEALMRVLEEVEPLSAMAPAESLGDPAFAGVAGGEDTSAINSVSHEGDAEAKEPESGALFLGGSPWDSPPDEAPEVPVAAGPLGTETVRAIEAYASEEDIQELLANLRSVEAETATARREEESAFRAAPAKAVESASA